MGLDSLVDASEETRDEEGEMVSLAFIGGGGGGVCEDGGDVLWCRREGWRDRDAPMVLGVRKSSTGRCVLCGIVRANNRVHTIVEAICALWYEQKW
jgi:hypothetical protein